MTKSIDTPMTANLERSPGLLRRLREVLGRRAFGQLPEGSPYDIEPSEETYDRLRFGEVGELVIGSPEANQFVAAINLSPGRVASNQYLAKDRSPDTGREFIGSFEYSSALLAQFPEGALGKILYSSIPIRVDKIVEAVGFENFLVGRGGSGHKTVYDNGTARDLPSRKVIKEYSRRRGEFPPVKTVLCYVQPNGETYFSVVGDGSHRVAAAKKRGDDIIAAYNVDIVRLSTDAISDNIELVEA